MFLVLCSLVFKQQHQTYQPTAHLNGAVKEAALAWAWALWGLICNLLLIQKTRAQKMGKVSVHPLGCKAQTFSLCQGHCSCSILAIKCQTFSARSGLNDVAMQGAFQCALNDSINDELVPHEECHNLNQLIAHCISVDNPLRKRHRYRTSAKVVSFSSSTSHSPPLSICQSRREFLCHP